MKSKLLLLLLFLSNLLFAQQRVHPIANSRPSDFNYLSAPDSLGRRTQLKTLPALKQSSNGQILPYPIIFIHGLSSRSDKWDNTTNDMDALYGAMWGGRFDFCLNYDGDYYSANTNFWPTPGADITYWTTTLTAADYYYLNFDVGTDGSYHPTSLSSVNVKSNQAAVVKQGVALSEVIYNVLQVTGRDKVILMGHSMGGLAAREYLQNPSLWQPDGQHHVAKLVTTGTPHGGSNSSSGNLTSWFGGIDEQSEAIRDLRRSYYYSGDNGVFLFGGLELQNNSTHMNDNINLSGIDFYNVDVNCNGNILETITGLNQKSMYTNLDYSCIIGECANCILDTYQGDGVVNDISANLKNYYPGLNVNLFNYYDNVSTTEIHTDLQNQTRENMWGLDEPNEFSLSYHIGFDTTYTGFTTEQPVGGYPYDYDDFTFSVTNASYLTANVNDINLPDFMAHIVNSSYNTVGTIHHSSGSTSISFTELLSAGNYFLEIYGTPTSSSYLYQYTFTLHASPVGIEEISIANNISIYPNPTQGSFTISSSLPSNDLEIKITNVLDEEIYKAKMLAGRTEIDLTNNANGIYFIQVNSEKGSAMKKIILAK